MAQRTPLANPTLLTRRAALQFAGLALAVLCVDKGTLYPALAGDPLENPPQTARDGVSRVVVTAVGHWRGEGAAVVEKV